MLDLVSKREGALLRDNYRKTGIPGFGRMCLKEVNDYLETQKLALGIWL